MRSKWTCKALHLPLLLLLLLPCISGRSGSREKTQGSYWQRVQGDDFKFRGSTRRHYIRAEEVLWDYAPSGKNMLEGRPFSDDENVFVKDNIGSTYLKCLYFGYTGPDFSTRVPEPAAYLGFLGPIIHAEVGNRIEITFQNRCSFPNSVHAHGVVYKKDSEGAPSDDDSTAAQMIDDSVAPGGENVYKWDVPERAGPANTADAPSSKMWLYHSHTNEVLDTYSGLTGALVITRKGSARWDGTPKDVDAEVFTLFEVMDENNSHYLEQNTERAGLAAEDHGEGFEESNLMHAMNGFVYGNLPVVMLQKGTRVRWYVFALGTEVDLHTPHWHGNTVFVHGRREDVVNLLPASQVTADMVPDQEGTWLYHCHVNDHILAGMVAHYKVTRKRRG